MDARIAGRRRSKGSFPLREIKVVLLPTTSQSIHMSEPVVFLPLTKGYVAVIDFDDFEKVRGFKYHADVKKGLVYAARNIQLPDGRKRIAYLHRDLMGTPLSQVDHRDGDGLNNRRENLRPATSLQNQRGFHKKRPGASSKFRGVSWHALSRKWRASINIQEHQIYIGLFAVEEDAARAYDAAAKKYFGEFASPNF